MMKTFSFCSWTNNKKLIFFFYFTKQQISCEWPHWPQKIKKKKPLLRELSLTMKKIDYIFAKQDCQMGFFRTTNQFINIQLNFSSKMIPCIRLIDFMNFVFISHSVYSLVKKYIQGSINSYCFYKRDGILLIIIYLFSQSSYVTLIPRLTIMICHLAIVFRKLTFVTYMQ